jgi:hypothetical protein
MQVICRDGDRRFVGIQAMLLDVLLHGTRQQTAERLARPNAPSNLG